jgi:hypothetical protein
MSALVAGYEWSQEFELAPAAVYFPVGCALRAQVRESVGGTLLATLSSVSGTLVRVSDTMVRVIIPAGALADRRLSMVVFDLARTDVAPDRHYGFIVTVPVVQPVTTSTDAVP